jgi:glycosyltransferase involved in cell wall biosynthesis
MDATPYLVEDGVTGVLVDDPRSPKQIAEKACWLLAHPKDAARMGLSGYAIAKSNHLFSHFQERFWQAVGAMPASASSSPLDS